MLYILKIFAIAALALIVIIGGYRIFNLNDTIELNPPSPMDDSKLPQGEPIASKFPSEYMQPENVKQMILSAISGEKNERLLGITKNKLDKYDLMTLIDRLVGAGYIVTHYSNAALKIDKRTVKEDARSIRVIDTGATIFSDNMPVGQLSRLKSVVTYRYDKRTNELFISHRRYD